MPLHLHCDHFQLQLAAALASVGLAELAAAVGLTVAGQSQAAAAAVIAVG